MSYYAGQSRSYSKSPYTAESYKTCQALNDDGDRSPFKTQFCFTKETILSLQTQQVRATDV